MNRRGAWPRYRLNCKLNYELNYQPNHKLKFGLKDCWKVGASLSVSLSVSFLSWCVGSASLAAEQTNGACSDNLLADLSTDLLETPVETEILVPDTSDEIPEEILRTEIITGARSPFTGEPMTAAEYAQLQEKLDEPAGTPLVSSDIRHLVFLLQLRRAVRPILPFIP